MRRADFAAEAIAVSLQNVRIIVKKHFIVKRRGLGHTVIFVQVAAAPLGRPHCEPLGKSHYGPLGKSHCRRTKL
jgi:hypothetical protein